jgi:hypothetical protein
METGGWGGLPPFALVMSRTSGLLGVLGIVLLVLPYPRAEAQRRATIQIGLPQANLIARDAPQVATLNLLTDSDDEALIKKGFPSQLRYTVALWPAEGMVGRSIASTDWRVIVDYEPLERIFRVVRFTRQDGYQSLGSYRSFRDVIALLGRPYQPRIRAPSEPGRYFYTANLEVERMAENDLAEMRSWLGTAVSSERNPGSALMGFIGSLVRQLIGAPKREYSGKSEVFELPPPLSPSHPPPPAPQ